MEPDYMGDMLKGSLPEGPFAEAAIVPSVAGTASLGLTAIGKGEETAPLPKKSKKKTKHLKEKGIVKKKKHIRSPGSTPLSDRLHLKAVRAQQPSAFPPDLTAEGAAAILALLSKSSPAVLFKSNGEPGRMTPISEPFQGSVSINDPPWGPISAPATVSVLDPPQGPIDVNSGSSLGPLFSQSNRLNGNQLEAFIALQIATGEEEGRKVGRKAITSDSREVVRKLLLPPLVRSTLSLGDQAPVAGPSTERVKSAKKQKRGKSQEAREVKSTQVRPPREGSPPALPRRIESRRGPKAPGGGVPSGGKPLPHQEEGSPPRRSEAAAAANILQPVPRRNLELGEPGRDFVSLGQDCLSGLPRETVPPQTSVRNHRRMKALTPMGHPLLKPLLSSWHPPEAR
ncbi:uncharacterized protein LOC128333645 [Hemicordylus capensis]|uniref:uncharacterized protein LOC128333645 n=1 Tax=Hemicordylus capensis TaxID=884348 RepID=UPI0023039B81|nr:uncharacterized protein LOC128333645 [Hemicordylus capensis]XP_053125332.1 uncharacterized protein LOC128333645 [Hemicordylus capensis]XP_053125333.1 uncharacterized protein LOC128333645 [Hemicordylus capensis]XP_053125334.1 uncharacterized protein LOC128333645 [Hemicordylus capensis]XP_053125335.1 uncharacterized protein LOC128333645 [Hemicordylus capensis]